MPEYVYCDICERPLDIEVHTPYVYVTALCDECIKDWMIVLKQRPKENDAA